MKNFRLFQNSFIYNSMRSSERRCKLSEYFRVFLKNILIRIKIMRKIVSRAICNEINGL